MPDLVPDISNVTPLRRGSGTTDRIAVSEPGVAGLVSQLTDDAKELARAEIALQKAKVGEAVGRYKNAAIFFAAAGVLALTGFIALLVGLIATLATRVGPGFATLIVVGIVFVTAGILATIGKKRLSVGGAA